MNKDINKPHIIHIMKNGEVRESIEGYIVPVNDKTKIAYMLLASVILKKKE